MLQRIARESADRHENPTQNIIRARPEYNSPRHRPGLCVVYAVRVWQVHYTQIHSSAACLAQGGGDCLSGCGLGHEAVDSGRVEWSSIIFRGLLCRSLLRSVVVGYSVGVCTNTRNGITGILLCVLLFLGHPRLLRSDIVDRLQTFGGWGGECQTDDSGGG